MLHLFCKFILWSEPSDSRLKIFRDSKYFIHWETTELFAQLFVWLFYAFFLRKLSKSLFIIWNAVRLTLATYFLVSYTWRITLIQHIFYHVSMENHISVAGLGHQWKHFYGKSLCAICPTDGSKFLWDQMHITAPSMVCCRLSNTKLFFKHCYLPFS